MVPASSIYAFVQSIPVFYDLYMSRLPGGWRLREMLCKLRRPIVPREVYESGRKLNLGSGDSYLDGYVNVDILPERNPDIVAPVDRLDFASDEEYDLVRASHILEHFTYEEGGAVVAEWRRVLKQGGYLVLCCPDYIRLGWRTILCPNGLDPVASKDPDRALSWINGLYALDLPPEYRHKVVFNHRSLSNLLSHNGMSVLGRQVYQVEHPYTLGVIDDSCAIYSLNLVARRI